MFSKSTFKPKGMFSALLKNSSLLIVWSSTLGRNDQMLGNDFMVKVHNISLSVIRGPPKITPGSAIGPRPSGCQPLL